MTVDRRSCSTCAYCNSASETFFRKWALLKLLLPRN